MKSARLSALALLCTFTALHSAPVDSRITAVTVYSDRAVVTRTATVDLPAGQTELVFEKLPASLVDQSLQVSGNGSTHATILDVNARVTFVEASVDPRVKSIQDDIRTLQKQLRVYTDRAAVLEEQRELLKRINTAATTPAPAATNSTPAPRSGVDDWQKLMTFSDESLAKILAEQQSLDDSKENLQAKIDALAAQLRELSGQQSTRRSYKTVTVRVAAGEPGRLDLTLAYAVPGASWAPAYDARLHSEERIVELNYFGVVRQNTSEDWRDITLTLSTARPSLGGNSPEPAPWIVDVLDLPKYKANTDKFAAYSTSLGGLAQERRKEGIFNEISASSAPGSVDATTLLANVENGVTSASFRIPVTATILSDNAQQKVGISTARLNARLQYQATPRAMETAFLSAYTTNATEYPLLGGVMNTFLDNAFIATSSLKTVMPGEKFELALGADEGIAIKRKLVNRFSEDTGLTSKGRRITYEFLVTVQNNKKTAERIVFKDVLPVSRNEKIEVKLLAPAEKDVGTADKPREVTREADGRLVWRLDLKPGEKREVPLKFSIEYPGDIQVTGLE